MGSNIHPEASVLEALSRLEDTLMKELDRLVDTGGQREARAWSVFALFVVTALTVIAAVLACSS